MLEIFGLVGQSGLSWSISHYSFRFIFIRLVSNPFLPLSRVASKTQINKVELIVKIINGRNFLLFQNLEKKADTQ